MDKEYKHNPALYFFMKVGVWTIFLVLLICGCVAVYCSLAGVIYNPIYHFPADCINSYLQNNLVPFSIPEFNRIYTLGEVFTTTGLFSGALAIMLFSIGYLIIVSCLTFYLFCSLGSILCSWLDDCCQKYKYGEKG